MTTTPLIRSPFARLGLALSASVTLLLGACVGSLPSVGTLTAPATGFVYSANEGADSVSRIDLATGRVTTLQLPITPHNVQISRDGRRLFAVGSMAGQMKMAAPAAAPGGHAHAAAKEPGGLLIWDAAATNAASATLVAVGRAPAHVIVDARGERAYVSNSEDNALSVVDASRGSVVGSIPTAASPHGLRMSSDGREIYVAATKGNAVSVIDVATSKAIAHIPVGKAPVQLGFTPDGNFMYVANQGTERDPDNTVSTIDTATQRVIDTVPVGAGPGGITYRPASR